MNEYEGRIGGLSMVTLVGYYLVVVALFMVVVSVHAILNNEGQ